MNERVIGYGAGKMPDKLAEDGSLLRYTHIENIFHPDNDPALGATMHRVWLLQSLAQKYGADNVETGPPLIGGVMMYGSQSQMGVYAYVPYDPEDLGY